MKNALLVFILLVSAGFSATININACGSYTPVNADIINLTSNIYANLGSTITSGACVKINFVQAATGIGQTFTIYGRGKQIIQNGSSASIGVLISMTSSEICTSTYSTTAILDVTTGGNLTINGFPQGIQLLNGITIAQKCYASATINNLQNSYVLMINASTYGIIGNWTGAGMTNISALFTPIGGGLVDFWNNASTPYYIGNVNGNAIAPQAPGLSIGGCNLNLNSSSIIWQGTSWNYSINYPKKSSLNGCYPYFTEGSIATNTTGSGFPTTATNGTYLFSSNKVFSWNANITTAQINTSNSGDTAQWMIYNRLSSTLVTSANWWVHFNNSYYVPANTTLAKYTIVNIILTGKFYYCIGGYCNPLYFTNYTPPTTGFYINIPDSLAPVQLTNNYTSLNVYWKQGFVYYLVVSSYNSSDSIFYFLPNAELVFELNNGTNTTNYTVINQCPSIFNICTITLENATANISTLLNPRATCNWSSIYNVTVNGTNVTAANATCNASAAYNSTLTFMYYLANGTNISNSYTNSFYQDILKENVTRMEIRINGLTIYAQSAPRLSIDANYGFVFFFILFPIVALFRRPTYILISAATIILSGYFFGIIFFDFGWMISIVLLILAYILLRGDR